MEFEFWWLLALPVFFGMGWVAARVDLKSLLSESRALPSSYFRGLNFLLKEQPSVSLAFPPVGWHRTVLQEAQKTTVEAWEKTVVIWKHPGHLTSMKKELGDCTRRFNLC